MKAASEKIGEVIVGMMEGKSATVTRTKRG